MYKMPDIIIMIVSIKKHTKMKFKEKEKYETNFIS